MIGEMRGGLDHVATVAGGADAAAFAGKGHDKARAAARAQRTAESEAEQPALEIAAELLLHIAGHGPLSGFPPGEPALEVLGDYSVERRLLGAAPLVTAGRGEDGMSDRPYITALVPSMRIRPGRLAPVCWTCRSFRPRRPS